MIFRRHIYLNINRQTTRFLGFERPVFIVGKDSARVTIWCAVSAHGIIGPYFVEDGDQHRVTVNQEWYRTSSCLADALTTAEQTIVLIGLIRTFRERFGKRIISRGADLIHPSYSADMMAPDPFGVREKS